MRLAFFMRCLGWIFFFWGTGLHAQSGRQAALEEWMQRNELSQLSYVVIDSGKVVAKSEVGSNGRNGSVHPWGSLAKSAMALHVYHLDRAGILNVNDLVAEYLPEWKTKCKGESCHELRILQLLEHTSGLDELHFKDYFWEDSAIWPSLSTLCEELDEIYVARWQPGLRQSYSNLNYLLLARLLELVEAQDFQALMEKCLRKDLNLPDAKFEPQVNDLEWQAAFGASIVGEQRLRYKVYPAMGLWGSLEDAERFLSHWLALAQDTLDGLPMVRRMAAGKSLASGKEDFWPQHGSGIRKISRYSDEVFGYEGNLEGHSAWFKFNVDANSGLFVMVNSGKLNGTAQEDLERILGFRPKKEREFGCDISGGSKRKFLRSNPRNQIFAIYDFLWGRAESDGVQVFESNRLSEGRPYCVWNDMEAWEGDLADGTHAVEIEGRQYVGANPFWADFGLELAKLISKAFWVGLGLALFQLLRSFWGHPDARGLIWPALISILPSLATVYGDSLLSRANIPDLASINGLSLGLAICSYLILFSTLYLPWLIFRRRKSCFKTWDICGPILSFLALLNLCWAIVLASFGLLPLHTFWY